VLAHVKNNLGPLQPSLAYEVRSVAGAPPVLSWLGTSPRTADELLAKPVADVRRPLERAKDFLSGFLQGGPRTTREIWAAAQPEGFSARTLQRAREEMEIRFQQQYVDGKKISHWLLKGQRLPASEVPDLEEWLAPLREKYPPSTPLDEDED
jgi:hypothetical protein